MTNTTPNRSSTPRRSRREFRYGPGPIVVVIAASLLLLCGWRTITDPNGPSKFTKYDPSISHLFDAGWETTPLYWYGELEPDGLLVVGDSRASATISVRVFEEHGVEPVAVLWNGLAQLRDLLRAARELPPRRLLVTLTPASVYTPTLARMEAVLASERAKTPMQLLDERLDQELSVARERLLRTLDFNEWLRGPAATKIEERRQEGLYDQLLAPVTREKRWERLAELRDDLARLRDDGWKIACVRLPLQAGLELVEDKGFPRDHFTKLCENLGLPYLDMFDRGYETSDGSHLLGYEADRASAEIAEWVKTLGW